VQQIGELVQLRRWPDAALALEAYLSQPARTQQLRVQALAFLAPVLARLGRFDDSIAVQTHLIEDGRIDPASSAALRIGRAMAMLHEDHLFDADRAISELRRGPAAGSGALALLEIYRDVKTGHPAEAIDIFQQKLPALREQLGHRAADAYALVARAYDLLGKSSEACAAFRNATLLAPVVELFRRYSEVQKMADRYQPAPAPPEAA
jgi:tetratricopeptide (TPR) repeat protein